MRRPAGPACFPAVTSSSRRHWFRVKFGANRFRLFFRADSASRIVVHAWVNDRDTLRKVGAASEAVAGLARTEHQEHPHVTCGSRPVSGVTRYSAR